jgi:hypothetical protein
MPKKRKKMAQISLRIDAHLKEAAETAATEDHRSLTSLVEQLLASHIRRRHVLSMSRRPSKEAARAASQLAAREVENIADKSVSAEEQESRKRRLIRGPKEFRDIRNDQPKSRR